MIRILHVVSTLNKASGVMNVIMNYYKNIDRSKVQFDFLYFAVKENTYEKEIKHLGGQVFYIERLQFKKIKKFIRSIDAFFAKHKETYKAIQLHEVYLNLLIFPIAKKYRIKNCIVHVHTTKYSDKRLNAVRNYILCIPIKRNATHFIACSEDAGTFYFGRDYIKRR